MSEPEHLRIALIVWLVLTAVCGLAGAGLWWRFPRLRAALAPQTPEAVPWSGAEVYFLFLAFFFLPGIVQLALQRGAEEPGRLQPWSKLVAGPLLVGLVLVVTHFASGTRARQLGLTTRRLSVNLGVGLLVGLVATPAVNALHAGVSWLMLEGFHTVPEEHGLVRLARQGLGPLEWMALVGAAVLAAPIVEELFFRGVLQRWLAAHAWGGDAGVALALGLAVLVRMLEGQKTGPQGGFASLASEMAPLWFVLATVPGYLLVRRYATTSAPTAIWGSALTFAAIHSTWPTPIPLFAFGLVLGTLAQRTQSLVAPVVVHAVFNAAACVVLRLLV